jgi:DNA polymerase I-like protein with 3'-5' exonuclease and polymerase domains
LTSSSSDSKFNSGNGAIAAKMGMPYEWVTFTTDAGEEVTYRKPGPEAMRVINLYHSRLPGVKALADRASEVAKVRGYIKTHHGRRLRFPDKRYLYKASGLLIQATAADINKEVIRRLCGELQRFDARLLLNTHDSYSMSMPEDRSDEAWREIEHSVRGWFPWFRIPLIMELSGKGTNWWEAVK